MNYIDYYDSFFFPDLTFETAERSHVRFLSNVGDCTEDLVALAAWLVFGLCGSGCKVKHIRPPMNCSVV